MVSAVFIQISTQVATENKRSGATPVDVPELDKDHREPDDPRLEIYQTRF